MAEPSTKLVSTSDCQCACDFTRATASYTGSSSSAQTAGCSAPYSSTYGVIAVVISITSALGKLVLPLPWNHWFGSLVWLGREREKASFMTPVVAAPMRSESVACHEAWPKRESSPSQNAPARTKSG